MKANMKKMVILYLVMAISLSTVTAADSVTIWVNSQVDKNYYEKMVQLYKETEDKSFEAEIRSFGFMQLPEKLGAAIKTGINTPDIVQIDEMLFSIYLQGPSPFVDLTEKLNKSKLKNDLLPQRLSIFEYQGKQYGLPQSLGAVVLYYRTDLFEKLKIEPDSLATWDGLIEAGKKIKGNEMDTKLLALDWSYFEILLRQRGFQLFNKDGSHNLDKPETLETLEFICNLAKDGVAESPDRGSIFEPTFFGGDIINEEVAGIIGAGWYGLDMIQSFSPEELEGKWRAMPLPAWKDKRSKSDRRTSTFSGQGLLIYNGSKQIDTCWTFMEWVMLNKDASVERFLQGNAFPASETALEDDRMLKELPMFGDQKLGKLMKDLSHDLPSVVQSPGRIAVIGMLRERYWGDLMYNVMTPKEVLESIIKDLQKASGPEGKGP
jgi:ABC-type glycerol-3-phosphate transport system substrate-binding protein